MKKLLFIIFLTSGMCSAQNLIPNPSFELGNDSSGIFTTTGDYVLTNTCSIYSGSAAPTGWSALNDSPDRLKQVMSCNWDANTAQAGQFYLQAGNTESCQGNLTENLQTGSTYQFSAWLQLETLRSTVAPTQVRFTFDNPYSGSITYTVSDSVNWVLFQTLFTPTANSTVIKIQNLSTGRGTDIDNLTLIKTIPLPVNWLYIRTSKNTLEWATASEFNTDRFEIYNGDGDLIFTVPAAGNSSTTCYYSARVPQGYYVIKQIDWDGKFSYSKVVFVQGEIAINEKPVYYDTNGREFNEWDYGRFRK